MPRTLGKVLSLRRLHLSVRAQVPHGFRHQLLLLRREHHQE